ncbi:MAG: hypothetical protein J0I06_02055 [Planctomycetes bacterium]|nr:hypothetical protein [Planctomycetota bacterium]
MFERAACESACDSSGDVLHLIEVHVEVRSVFSGGSMGDDFTPLLGQFLQSRQLLR